MNRREQTGRNKEKKCVLGEIKVDGYISAIVPTLCLCLMGEF